MSALSGKTILVVDDEVDLREILIDELESHSAFVLSAESGQQASEIFKTKSIDLVITDIRMAGGSGVELLDQIKLGNSKKAQVVMVTGFSDMPIEEVYHRGAANVFIKPFDLGKFVSSLEKLMTPFEDRNGIKPTIAQTKVLKFEQPNDSVHGSEFKLGHGGFFMGQSHGRFKVDDVIQFNIEFINQPDMSFQGIAQCRWTRNDESAQGAPGAGFEIIEIPKAVAENFNRLNQCLVGAAYIPKG